jgi:hypothetical protein
MTRRRSLSGAAGRAAFLGAGLVLSMAWVAGQVVQTSPLFKDARQSLAIAKAQGRAEITLLVAAKPGAAPQVAKAAERLGGSVRFRDDEIGYLRVRIPLGRITEFVNSERVEAVSADVDGTFPYRLSAPGAGRSGLLSGRAQEETREWPPRWSDYPLVHPYSPVGDLDAAAFLRLHPTFDGRGVTIALLDGNFDLLLSEFQTAYALDGRKIPKVADYLNVTDPRDDAGQMPQWVDMREEAESRGLRVGIGGKTFTTPRDGRFRVGFFSERRWNDPANAEYMGQDLDRNGNPRGDDGLFGVLWDEKTNDVWVDTDRNLDFTDEKALTDYIRRPEIGVFGRDDPATPYRDSIGFAVQTDAKNKYVSINVGIYQHATEIMGSVVGNKDPAGRLTGVAPGARLVSMYYGSIFHAMIEGLIAAFKHPEVDLIVMEQSVNLASLSYNLSDGRHPLSIIAQRLIERYRKLLFVPGDNSPAFGYVAEDGAAPDAVSVGGYQSRESYRMNTGFVPEPADNMHWGALSHGPGGNGSLKPDLLAPSGQMSTDIGYVYREFEQEFKGLYQLPPGYFVDGGTSTATPMAAGATALVVSAARQSGVPWDAKTLKSALTGSARFIPSLRAHEQGNGLIQVAAAFERLKAMPSRPAISISCVAPVKTRLSHLLHPPHSGPGLYEREGWTAGAGGVRTVTVTRTSGPKEVMTFQLNWEGNDGTFQSASTLALPLNQPVGLDIRISVGSPGAHSAILAFSHPSIPGFVHRMPAAVVGAYRFSATAGSTISAEIDLPRPGDRPVFVDVPVGVGALVFSARIEEGEAQLAAISPSRDYIYPGAFDAPPGVPRVIANPEPGVWEINVCTSWEVRDYKPSRPKPAKPTKATVTASLIGMTAEPGSLDPDSSGSSGNLPVKIANRFAGVSAGLSAAELGSAFTTEGTIGPGEQRIYEIMVPPGASNLLARVSNVSGPGTDLDLYLIDCTQTSTVPAGPPPAERDRGNKAPPAAPPGCSPRAKAAAPDGKLEVEVRNPKPGRWMAVIDAYAVPSGGAHYAYVDYFGHPKFGSLAGDDHPQTREPGAAWLVRAHAWAAGLPEPPRSLMARFLILCPDFKLADGSPAVAGSAELDLRILRPKNRLRADAKMRAARGYTLISGRR